MRKSFMSMMFAAALLFKCYVLSGALPMARAEDSSLEQDTFASLLSDKVTENSLQDADLPSEGKMRSPVVMVDPSLWRNLLALHRGPPLYKRRVDYDSQVTEHKDASPDLNIPILRRDNMRCMVGRVYRPCWEA